jgi:acetate kinase
VVIDEEMNSKAMGKEMLISPRGHKPEIWVLATNEEQPIAEDAYEIIRHD